MVFGFLCLTYFALYPRVPESLRGVWGGTRVCSAWGAVLGGPTRASHTSSALLRVQLREVTS